ncbi:hypothetical protein A8H34_16630 [Burkholderia thailandensis]|nr:hypothetical protein A8H38_16080 [Burkholderia thailandensis]PNE79762.1 hypothetical protein A8H34_16630 [Burkholderia thailandensis]PNE85703.1 hypothetical protein A8H30_16280 [Burkholderia thailandensis]
MAQARKRPVETRITAHDAPGVRPRRNVAARRVKCRQTQGVPPADAVPSRMEAIVGKFIEIKR